MWGCVCDSLNVHACTPVCGCLPSRTAVCYGVGPLSPPEQSTAGRAACAMGIDFPVRGGWKPAIKVSRWVSPEAHPLGLQAAAFSPRPQMAFSECAHP